MSSTPTDIFTGIEIGTSSIKVAICKVDANYHITLLGWGEAPSMKVVKGDIKDLPFVVDQITSAVEEAERTSHIRVEDTFIYLAISGTMVKLESTVGRIDFSGASLKINDEHIIEANRRAQMRPKDDKYMVLYEYTRYFKVDERCLPNPQGTVGKYLEAYLHSVMVNEARLGGYTSAVSMVVNKDISNFIYTPMAVGFACFCHGATEKPHDGCLVIDVGAGVTSYVLTTGDDIFTMGQITVGCDHAANDIAVGFALPISSARKILKDFERMHCSVIPTADGRARLIPADLELEEKKKNLPASSVEQIVQARFGELFTDINKEIEQEDGWQWASGGIMLSGGGAMIPGIKDLAEMVFRRPVTIVRLADVDGDPDIVNSPMNIVPLGLVRVGRQEQALENQNHPKDVEGILTRTVKALFKW